MPSRSDPPSSARDPLWIVERGQDLELATLIDPNTTALVVIDVQNDFCHPEGAFGRAGHDTSPMPDVAHAIRNLLNAARERQVFTIFVRATYDREVTSRSLAQNRRRRGLVQSLCLEGTWGADWYDGVVPVGAPNEVVLTKHRFDAFQGTPFDLYLRNNRIRTVVVTGVATSGCVESTVRDAFFHDYAVVVARDAVAEAGQVYHEHSLGVMKRAFATIADTDAIVAAWRQSSVPVEPAWRAEQKRSRVEQELTAEGLVLVDIDRLDTAQAAVAERLAATARESGVPIFAVRTVDVALGRSAWHDGDTAGGKEISGPSTPAEMHVNKMRRSAFADTRLGLLLRTNEVRHVTVAGTDAVTGSLAATILHALDADYAVTLAGDACDSESTALARAGAHISDSTRICARWRTQAGQKRDALAKESPQARVTS